MNSDEDNFIQEFLAANEKLRDFYESEQYKLSLEVIAAIYSSYASIESAAKQAGLTEEFLNRITSGDNTIEIHYYEETLKKLQSSTKITTM